jgi:hypothetical protein
MILLPRWPISFIEDVQRYAEVASGRNPLEVFGEFILPGNPALVATILGSGLLVLTIAAWIWGLGGLTAIRRIAQGTGELSGTAAPFAADTRLDEVVIDSRFDWVLFWTITVSLLVLFQTGSTNQALLFIPLFFWFWQGLKRWGRLPAVLFAIVIVITPWILFLTTISGDYENPLLLLPLPFFCLILLGLKWFRIHSDALPDEMETAG